MGNLDAVQIEDPLSDEFAWRNQAQTYGQDFAAIYDLIFPLNREALDCAKFLFKLGHSAPVTGKHPTVPISTVPVFCEFGVGTGRIAIPLAEIGAKVVGADTSTELLASAKQRVLTSASPPLVELIEADIRDWVSPYPALVAYCVCGTISMLESEESHLALLRNMLRSTVIGGSVVIETHNPDRIRLLHRESSTVEFAAAVDGISGGLRTVAQLGSDGSSWSLTHSWKSTGRPGSTEFSRLIEPERLTQLAATVGLLLVDTWSGWNQETFNSLSPTYISVFKRLA